MNITARRYIRYAVVIPLLFAYWQSARIMKKEGWQLCEVPNWSPQCVAAGVPHSLKDFRRALDWQLLEYEPRLTRPLGNAIQIFESPVRARLWRWMVVPPAFSLTWPVTFVVAPLFLYLLLRRLGVERWLAVLGVAMYVANPGVLSLGVLFFRPGKAMANAAILLCLWLAAELEASRREGASGRRFDLRFAGLCGTVFFSLFFDEGMVILLPALVVLFPRLVFRSKAAVGLFLSIPAAYAVTILKIMPRLTRAAGYPSPGGYSPESSLFGVLKGHVSASEYKVVWNNILGNAKVVLEDSFGLIRPRLTGSNYYSCVFFALSVLGLVYAVILLLRAWKGRRELRTFPASLLGDTPAALAMRASVVLLGALVFEGVLMSISVGPIIPRVWGLYYYGVFCTIFVVLTLALVWRAAPPPRSVGTAFILAVVCGTTFIFPATNQAYKQYHYYPRNPNLLWDVFLNKINRFQIPHSDTALLRRKAAELRQARSTHQPVLNIPTELLYAAIEMRLVTQPVPCFGWAWASATTYFDLQWEQDQPRLHWHN